MKDPNYPIVSQNEITSLNLADLDVQELENRLELSVLATAAPDSGDKIEKRCWLIFCGKNGVSDTTTS